MIYVVSTGKEDVECTDFDEVMEQIYKGKNVLILGGAGTGKTTLLKRIIDELKIEGNVVMTAPTWIAALNLSDNAVSTMSAFNTHPKGLNFNDSAKHRLEKSLAYNADYLIIDEISLISKELFSFIYVAIKYINS